MRIPLRVKFFAFGCLLALMPLALVGTRLVTITRDELKSAANEELARVAAGVAGDIDSTFRGRFLSPLMVLRNGIDSGDLDVHQKISLLTQGLAGAPDIKALQITIDGAPLPILVTADDFVAELEAAGIDPVATLQTAPEELETILRSGLPIVERLDATDRWLASVAMPLDAQFSGRDLTLSTRIDLRHLSEMLARNPFARRGEITVVDRGGTSVLEDGGGRKLSDRQIVASAAGLIDANARAVALEGYTRPNGDEMLGAYAFTEALPWAVVAELREQNAYAVVDQMTRSVLLVAAFGIAAAVVGSIFTARRATEPILRLGAAAERLGQGDFSVRVPVGRVRDEIGDLAARFNKMVRDLSERVELMKFVSQGTVTAIRRADVAGISRGGERRRVTILFTDIRGYTEFAERASAEIVVEMLNQYLDTQTTIVREHGGDVDKFVGDSLVALFEGEGMEARAVSCGLDIQRAMRRLLDDNREWGLRIGVGIASGEVVMGAMGARDRMDFTVLGREVNLAARLCAKAPPGEILVSPSVRQAGQALDVVFAALEPITLKGYSRPVEAYAASAATPAARAAV